MNQETLPDQYWHCYVQTKSPERKSGWSYSISNDLKFSELEEQILLPWQKNLKFVVNGKIINGPDDVEEIKITQTQNTKQDYANTHDMEMRASRIADMATDRRLLPIQKGNDYTHRLLFKSGEIAQSNTPTGKIFIVHGHDNEVKESVARFLEKNGLVPVILHEQPNLGKTIIEKFETHSDVGFAIVLLTADDRGALVNGSELSPRARQNVVFEMGYFIGKIGRSRVAALYKSDLELPSDINGIIYIKIDDAGAWKILLSKELKASGYGIDLNCCM
jgi:predicted nucleotide-binding protein